MKRDVILKVTTCVLICIALWLLLSIVVRSIIQEAAVGLANRQGSGEPDEPGAVKDDVIVKVEDLPLDGGLLDISTDNVLKFEAIDSELQFGAGFATDPLMTYNIDEQHWTLSDRFLEDVADALVPVLKERGFVQISYGPLSAYGVQADREKAREFLKE